MIEDLSTLTTLGEQLLWQVFAVFLRVGGMMALLPAFGEQSVPVRVKLGLAIAFAAVIFPAVPVPPMPDAAAWVMGWVLAETVTGLFFGLVIRLFVMALQVAGTIAAQSTSLSQIFGAAGMDPLPSMGHILVVGGLVLATIMGLHVQIAAYMINSYQLVPFGQVIPAAILTPTGIAEISRAFSLGFTLAAPFVVASLIYNVILGVINKAMPQLMVAFVGAPAITAGGLVLLMLAAPLMLSIWVDAMMMFMQDPLRDPR